MNTPTKITTSRIVLIVLMLLVLGVIEIVSRVSPDLCNTFYIFLGNSNVNVVYFAACIVFIIASATDFLDGYLARKNNQVTDLGKFLDPVADKLLVNSMIIFLCIPRVYTAPNQLVFPAFCAIIIIGRDIVVDALRFIAAKKNVVIAANYFGKAKTVLQMITIPLVLLNGWPFSYFDAGWNSYLRIANFFVYLTTIVSLLSGVIYVYQNRGVFKDENR